VFLVSRYSWVFSIQCDIFYHLVLAYNNISGCIRAIDSELKRDTQPRYRQSSCSCTKGWSPEGSCYSISFKLSLVLELNGGSLSWYTFSRSVQFIYPFVAFTQLQIPAEAIMISFWQSP